ncbi:MAG: ATPase [Lachnospiraceae bacterium]|nr:ATPase [Lachnospiraceae bacterium]
MVEKMKLLHITGPKGDIDRVMSQYLNHYEIHFENAMTSLNNLKNIRPFVETNLYKEACQKGEELKQYLERSRETDLEVTAEQAKEVIEAVAEEMKAVAAQREQVQEKLRQLKEWMVQIAPFLELDFELCKLRDFHFIDYQFGKIRVENYHKLEQYIHQNPYTLFYECNNDREYVWGVYFVPHTLRVELEAVYASFHFEEIQMPDDLEDTPRQAFGRAREQLAGYEQEQERLQMQAVEIVKSREQELLASCRCLEEYCRNFDIRKYAACTQPKDGGGEQYILYGWLAARDAGKLERDMAMDELIHWVEQEPGDDLLAKPPTKLKNPWFLKPFELYVEMYGLPAYHEMDPTLFVALTYTLMFGIMFGDVGQGAVLLAGGALLYQFKKMRLAGIVAVAGVWSVIFGFLYGSFFGFEDTIPALWRKPNGDIMTTLMVAIGFGAALILIAMALNIVNALRAKEYGRLLFDQSGVAGLICYGSVLICAALFLTGHRLPAAALIGAAVGIPLVAILLKEPLSHLLEKKKKIFPEGSKVMFFVEALVEGFDVVLSYATNTISFVRVGAFALSHAGMMGVVMTLAGLEQGNPNWAIIVLGNALVAGLEGLIVGIQVLRLEYYEMFSRFYSGTGKPFTAFRNKKS